MTITKLSCGKCGRHLQFDGALDAALPFGICAVCYPQWIKDHPDQELLDLQAQVKELKEAYQAGKCQCWQEPGDKEKAHGTHCPEQAALLMDGYCKRIKELKAQVANTWKKEVDDSLLAQDKQDARIKDLEAALQAKDEALKKIIHGENCWDFDVEGKNCGYCHICIANAALSLTPASVKAAQERLEKLEAVWAWVEKYQREEITEERMNREIIALTSLTKPGPEGK